METFRHEFGDWDWIEVRTELHHPYAMFTVAGSGIARKCYDEMPRLCTFKQAVEFITSKSKFNHATQDFTDKR